ncbi:MAG: prepilin-type N-terminal cleavage/methylation domain-containing protein [Acidimicrobiales bacterium]
MRADIPDEQGFTLVELMVAASAMLLLMSAFAGFMIVMMTTASSTTRQDNSTSAARVAMMQIQHDVQAANPLVTLAAVSDYGNTLKLEMETPSGTQQVVTWSYSPASGTLYRAVSTSSTAGGPVPEVSGLVNTSATPVFSYYDAVGNNLVASGTSSPSQVAICTARVDISLAVSAGPKTFPYTERMGVALPDNIQPGRSQCA